MAIDLKKAGLLQTFLVGKLEFGKCATLNWFLTPRQCWPPSENPEKAGEVAKN